MSIQFYHYNHDGLKKYTVAVALPDLDTIKSMVKETGKVTLQVGTTRVADGDNYNKKIGRELATSRLAPINFTETYTQFGYDKVSTIHELTGSNGYKIRIRINQSSQRVYLIEAY